MKFVVRIDTTNYTFVDPDKAEVTANALEAAAKRYQAKADSYMRSVSFMREKIEQTRRERAEKKAKKNEQT
jgi:hypothetical protein